MMKPYVEHLQGGRDEKRLSHWDVHVHVCASGLLKRIKEIGRVDK